MPLEWIAAKLVRLGLIDPDGGEGGAIAPAGRWSLSVAEGRVSLAIPRPCGPIPRASRRARWSSSGGAMGSNAMADASLAEVWEARPSPQWDAFMRPPRTSDYVSIGRLKRFGPTGCRIQSDSGEYGIVDERQTQKWRLTPLG